MRFAAILLMPTALSAQFISVGVMGGVPLTPAFNANSNGSPPPFALGASYEGAQQRTLPYIVGPTVQIHLWRGLFGEADFLYSHGVYNYESIEYSPDSGSTLDQQKHAVNTWETSLLAKYRPLRSHRLSPFVAGGVSFRYDNDREVQLLLGSIEYFSPPFVGQAPVGPTTLSTKPGLTIAGGAELHTLYTRFSLEIRYTRWANQSALIQNDLGPIISSNQNAAQLLLGLRW
jgi:hypothetical protein